MNLLFAATLACLAANASPVRNDALSARQMFSSPSVQIRNGTVEGRYEAGLEQDLFLSIPYAQPPVGDLRMRNPLPINTSFTEAYDATNWRNVCPGYGPSSSRNLTQNQPYVLSEDCLTISIIRPSGTSENDSLPILFWIFGGGFTQGTANDPRYNGSYIVQRSVEVGQPIIFASINYRLSAFGFPAGESAAADGVLNLGSKDQRLALHWVQENIAAFGGNPKKVVIWGQSAGGVSVTDQMVAYSGRDDGLFSGAIVTSGVFVSRNNTLASQQAGWNSLLNVTGCSADGDLTCLRGLPYDTLYSAIGNSTFNPSPIPDGDLLTATEFASIDQGKVVQRPLMVGATRDEATSGVGAPVGVNKDTAWRTAFAGYFRTLAPNNSTLDKAEQVFPNNNTRGCPFGTGDGVLPSGLQDKRINWVVTDNIIAGARYFAQKHSNVAPVYSFRFEQVPQNQSIALGVSHANELPFTFGVLNRTVRTPLGNRPGDLDTSRRIQTYWINFINNLDPNVGADVDLTWPKYDASSSNMVFENNNTRVASDDYRKESMDFLVELGLGRV